ncbi:MAG: hypothetical protein KF833_07870 [Verrucomicrobiae bacterium]|nr:hypothetical protein [Verrucomicrobiae bacterium]
MTGIEAMHAKRFLIVSVGLNVLLAALLLRSGSPSTADLDRADSGGQPATGESATSTSTAGPVVTHTVVREMSWQHVESPDYREYIANLRAIGCPEETIRDIIRADVNKLYDEKKKLARGAPKKFEYWKAGNPLAGMAGLMGDPEALQQMRALEEEKNAVLRALGIEPDPMSQMLAAVGGNPMEAMFDFLPEARRTGLMQVMADFQSKLVESAGDMANDHGAMWKAQREMEDAIRAMLSPEEFLDYQLRFSITATVLRQQITGFEPSEEEFLAMFKLREAFDREYSPTMLMDATQPEADRYREAQDQLNERLRETLGHERYLEYQRAQDPGYQQLHRIVQRAGLQPELANDLYAMRDIAMVEAGRVRGDQTLTADQQTAALRAIRQETEQTIQQTLGDDAWQQFNRGINRHWLRTIAP